MTIDGSDWQDLEAAWQAAGEEISLSEGALRSQLRRRRALVAIQTALEIISVSAAVLVALWIRRHSPGMHIGSLLLGWLVLQAVLVAWLRWREQVSDTSSVMEGIAASIERDERLVRSMRLGSLLSMLALSCVLLATAAGLFGGVLFHSPMLLAVLAPLLLYVFAVQVAILVWTRRVRRRRNRLEDIRRALGT